MERKAQCNARGGYVQISRQLLDAWQSYQWGGKDNAMRCFEQMEHANRCRGFRPGPRSIIPNELGAAERIAALHTEQFHQWGGRDTAMML
eukprot:1157809-Pelagomonas_calceolata.AAC.3